jgi:hypothetical protein
MKTEDQGLLPGIALACLFAIAGCALVLMGRRHRATLHAQIRLFLIAFGVRLALALAIYQFGLVQYVGDEDAVGWHLGAVLADQWKDQGVTLLELPFRLGEVFEVQNRGYQYMLGAFFYITDSPYRLAAATLNCFFGALTVVLAYRIAATLFSDWVATRVGWWTCLFPSMLIWAALTVKEPVVIFMETLALYGCVRLRELGPSPRHLLLCAVCILALLPFRFYAGYLVALAVILSLTAGDLVRPRRWIAALMLLGVLVPVVVGTGILAGHERQAPKFDLDYVQSYRKTVATGGEKSGAGSGVETDYDMRTPLGFGLGTAVGAAHLLLAPFPWQFRGSLRMLATAPELIYWWWLVFAGLIPGIVYCVRHRLADVLSLLVFVGGFGLLYSMMFGNVGLIFRQRAQLLPWLLIFAAVGLQQRALRAQAKQQGAFVDPLPPPVSRELVSQR